MKVGGYIGQNIVIFKALSISNNGELQSSQIYLFWGRYTIPDRVSRYIFGLDVHVTNTRDDEVTKHSAIDKIRRIISNISV